MQDYSFRKDKSILVLNRIKLLAMKEFCLGPLREPLSSIKNYKIALINGKNEHIEKFKKI